MQIKHGGVVVGGVDVFYDPVNSIYSLKVLNKTYCKFL